MISTVSRKAKLNAAIAWKDALSAVQETLGNRNAAEFSLNVDRLNCKIDHTTDQYASDPSLVTRQMSTPMKAGVNIATVADVIGALIVAAGRDTAADPTHDVDVITYAVKLFLVPAWEDLGHLNRVGKQITSTEDRVRDELAQFITTIGGGIQTTELVHQTVKEALDPVDTTLGSLPGDMANGLRKQCVEGAKEAVALDNMLMTSIRNRQPLPAKYTHCPLAVKYTIGLLLRLIAPVIAHRLKATNLFCTVRSVYDVALANDASLPIKVIIIVPNKDDATPASKKPRHVTGNPRIPTIEIVSSLPVSSPSFIPPATIHPQQPPPLDLRRPLTGTR